MSFEIRKVKNGYCIFEGGFAGYGRQNGIDGSPWVFESLDAALEFLRKEFNKPSEI